MSSPDSSNILNKASVFWIVLTYVRYLYFRACIVFRCVRAILVNEMPKRTTTIERMYERGNE